MAILRTVLPWGVLIILTNTVWGDLLPGRNPLPKPPVLAPVKVIEGVVDHGDPNVVTKIVIPKSVLSDLQAQSSGATASNESLPGGTVIAGLAMTAAAISLIFVNRTSPHRNKAILALIGCSLVVGVFLLAKNFAPQKVIGPIADPSQTQRLVVIEVQEVGHEVTVILPSRK